MKKESAIPAFGVLLGFLIMFISPAWGGIVMGAALGYSFAKFKDK